jgi:hypothetical protein
VASLQIYLKGGVYMRIKVYAGCVVDNHWGIYAAQRFAQLHPELLTEYEREVLNGPDSDEYCEVAGDIFPRTADNLIYDFNECGDILAWELIDSDKITVGQMNLYYTRDSFGNRLPIYECEYGYADIAQIGENCLCRVSLSNAGITGADCFFEMDDYFSFDENLQQFIEQEIGPILRTEFTEDYEIYTLPAYWASYLINGDCSGMSDSEIAEVDDFCRDKGCCVSCSDEEEEFRWRNDANNLGGSTLEFYFEVKKP